MQDPASGEKMDVSRVRELLGERAAQQVKSHMSVGLGSGSTTECFIRALGLAAARGALGDLRVVPSSSRSAVLAEKVGLRVQSLEEVDRLDLTVDGADQISPEGMLIKGGGGALFREKVLSLMSNVYIIIADERKFQLPFGEMPLPVEIAPFAWPHLRVEFQRFGAGRLRARDKAVWVTDNGNWLVDLQLKKAPENPAALHRDLKNLCGVLETGLFFERRPDAIYRGTPDLAVTLWRPDSPAGVG